jgi:uncharacterized caspase-like protein
VNTTPRCESAICAKSVNLARLTEAGRGGFAKDDVKALRLYQRAATRITAWRRTASASSSIWDAAAVVRSQEPGVEINKLFRLVAGDVLKATDSQQRPVVYGSLPGEGDYFSKTKITAELSYFGGKFTA